MKCEMRSTSRNTGEILLYGDLGEMFPGGHSAKDFAERMKSLGRPSMINMRLNSEGGDVFTALAIYNTLVRHPARVETDVDGVALSAASLVMLAGDEVRAASNAIIMLHDPWSRATGTAAELRSRADRLDKIEASVRRIYAERTGLSEQRIDEMMEAETWMEAPEALANGFVHSLTGAERVAAHVDRDRYHHIPDELLPPPKTPERLKLYREKVAAMKGT